MDLKRVLACTANNLLCLCKLRQRYVIYDTVLELHYVHVGFYNLLSLSEKGIAF